jgi:hypothetical protein
MPNIELLAYFPIRREDFLFFLVNGAPDGHGGWLTDQFGNSKTGVFNWLYGRGVPEAHFYLSDANDPIQIFVSTVQRLEQVAVPWTENICGFTDLIIKDGEVGAASAFPPFGSLAQAISTVRPSPDLDQKFVDGRTNLNNFFGTLSEKSLTAETQTLRAALRGEPGTNLQAISERLNLKLF